MKPHPLSFSRREILFRIGGGFGALGVASLLADAGLLANTPNNPLAPRSPHFTPRARRVPPASGNWVERASGSLADIPEEDYQQFLGCCRTVRQGARSARLAPLLSPGYD